MSVVLIGLSIGMLLFLLAAGLTLVFGMLGVINFAHGALYMLGAYVGYQIVQWTGSFWLALRVAPLVVGVVGALLERITLRPLYERDAGLPAAADLRLHPGDRGVHPHGLGRQLQGDQRRRRCSAGTVELFGSTVTDYRLFIIGFGALRVGRAVPRHRADPGRHGGARPPAPTARWSSCLGIDVGKVRTAVFGVGADAGRAERRRRRRRCCRSSSA